MSGRISNVKNRFCNSRQIGAAVMLIAAMTSGLLAQDRSRDRGAPIIFSSPKKDAISTNLHEVNQKESPFKNLESEIRKPFEMFDTGAPKPKFNHVRQTQAPAAPVNDSSLKAILEKSAEEQFLNGGNKGQEDLNDPFKSPDRTMDPLNNNKPKTALDRYYDRLEKEQMGRTNNNSSTDLFGRKKDRTSDEKSALEAKQDERLKGEEQDIYSRANRQMSNNTQTDNRLSRTGNNLEGNRMVEANNAKPGWIISRSCSVARVERSRRTTIISKRIHLTEIQHPSPHGQAISHPRQHGHSRNPQAGQPLCLEVPSQNLQAWSERRGNRQDFKITHPPRPRASPRPLRRSSKRRKRHLHSTRRHAAEIKGDSSPSQNMDGRSRSEVCLRRHI